MRLCRFYIYGFDENMNMKTFLPILLIFLFVAAAFFINRARHGASSRIHPAVDKGVEICRKCRIEAKKRTIDELRSTPFLEKYIVDVIDHGSSQHLGFKYGDMPAHMADEKAAPKIAAYVVTLSGRKPTHPEWVQEGRLLFISNCGGCHGEEGRGIHGTFPDLTRDPLLGIQKRLEEAN